eukprot:6677418-Ditylum_brightwellii.AAC.2
MVENLQAHFSKHFLQAQGTPMTKGLIANFLKDNMNTQVATVYKEGLLNVAAFPNIPEATKHIFTELQRK